MKNVYELTRGGLHPSPNLDKYLKSHKFASFWAIGNEGQSLRSLMEQELRLTNLRVGFPDGLSSLKYKGKNIVRAHSFIGVLLGHILTNQSTRDICLVGMSKKNEKGIWMVNVTDRVIEEYLLKGMCTFHDSRHEFVEVSPKRKKCRHCEALYKSKIVVQKRTEWKRI